MITLYTYGPRFGLPDGSPFVMKAQFLLKMAGIPYREDMSGYRQAPKGKLPYIEDDGLIVADSTFVRMHIERKYVVDFDRGLDTQQKGYAWAIEKMCEEHLYWMLASTRWLDDRNFTKVSAALFTEVPSFIRPLVAKLARQQVKKGLWYQGLGRHSPAEMSELANRDLSALSAILGNNPYLMGETPCGADASVGALVASILCAEFESPLRREAEAYPNLMAYAARLLAELPVMGGSAA